MARIDWVMAKLENWALWVQAEASGGSGYATQSVLLSEPVDRSREIDLRCTIDNTEALLTDKAVSSLRTDHAQIHRTLVCIYVEDRGVPGTAQQISRAVPTVHANLARGDVLLGIWFNRQRDAQATLKREYETMQTSAQI